MDNTHILPYFVGKNGFPIQKARKSDIAFDLSIPIDIELDSLDTVTVCLEVGFGLYHPYGVIIEARSSIRKQGIIIDGLIDTGYRGYVSLIITNCSKRIFKANRGDRLAQAIVATAPHFTPVQVEKEELTDTDRGKDSFGSSGKDYMSLLGQSNQSETKSEEYGKQKEETYLFTKKGDNGYTAVINGQPIPKYNPLIEIEGNLESLELKTAKLISKIGTKNNDLYYAHFTPTTDVINQHTEENQRLLFDIPDMLFGLLKEFKIKIPAVRSCVARYRPTGIKESFNVKLDWLEEMNDRMEEILLKMGRVNPKLTKFIANDGDKYFMQLDKYRIKVRQYERFIWSNIHQITCSSVVFKDSIHCLGKTLNRLSDLIFGAMLFYLMVSEQEPIEAKTRL